MTTKPKWVEALEEAEKCLRDSAACGRTDIDLSHTLNAQAQSWMDVARLYRDSGT
jgi:hypothetical protein